MICQPLPANFYARDVVQVARELLGKRLVRSNRQGQCVGRIVEVEAYLAQDDPACHAYRGPTRKNASMFGPPGRAYVYPIHARYCFNTVTESVGAGCAVLIRAIEPQSGLPLMRRRRGRDKLLELTRGPARLCQALAIDRRQDGVDLTSGRGLWIAEDETFDAEAATVASSPRVGVTSAQDLPLRFFLADSPYVSGARRSRALS